MFQTRQFDLAFASPKQTQNAPEIILIIKQEHLPELTKRLETLTKRFNEYIAIYLGQSTSDFILFDNDLFDIRFGYGACGFLTTSDDLTLLRVRLVRGNGRLYASATISMLLRALGFPIDEESSSNKHQVIEITTCVEHRSEGYGHAVGGYLSSSVIQWLREYAKSKASGDGLNESAQLPTEVLESMRTTWRAVTGREQQEYAEGRHINGWVRDSGAFSLICFGDACDLSVYPDQVRSELEEMTQFSCHNLDLSEQQLTLLAGLAKICELARESS